MSTVRIPVLVWRAHAGLYTACVADQPDLAAVGDSAAECVSQLKHHLVWLLRNEPWMFPGIDLVEPALTRVPVDVRPEYTIGRQRHPSERMWLTVPCVHSALAEGLLVCSIPPLRLWFSFHEADKLKELAGHYVREALQGKTPEQVARYMNAAEYELTDVVLTRQRERKPGSRFDWPQLEAVAEAMGERNLRRQFSRAFEREAEIAELAARVTRDAASVLLVGPPGVGKTSILVSAAREIERKIEAGHERRRFWLTSGSRLIAGTPYLGQWEERLELVIGSLQSFRGVLCIENLLELVRLGGHDASDSVGAFIVPYINHRELQVVAEATPAELDACRRLLPALAEAFQIINIAPFDTSRAVRVLEQVAMAGARNQRVETGNNVVGSIHRLFRRFRPYDAMPGRAVAFTTELIQRAAADGAAKLDENTVLQRFGDDTGLPELLIRDDMPLRHADVHAALSARVIGQPAACEAAAAVVTTFKAGMNDPARPLGVMLFSGPTGVGKTELARALADYLFGHGRAGERLVRLDMSEYSGPGAAERLVSDASGDASDFVKRVRSQPFCVILFDEIEKASPDVFDMLLAVFDEARMSDRFGRVTSFQSSVIIMTSNLGAGGGRQLGFGADAGPDYGAEVMRFFRPEFANRLDAIVAFNPLDEATIKQIASKELRELASREGFVKSGLTLSWDDAVVVLVASAGFDHRYGARPLQRALDELVATPLARHIAANPATRDVNLHLHVEGGRVKFEEGDAHA
jgi:ATP-dependent Clp protease ATP-binding subunit ClpC